MNPRRLQRATISSRETSVGGVSVASATADAGYKGNEDGLGLSRGGELQLRGLARGVGDFELEAQLVAGDGSPPQDEAAGCLFNELGGGAGRNLEFVRRDESLDVMASLHREAARMLGPGRKVQLLRQRELRLLDLRRPCPLLFRLLAPQLQGWLVARRVLPPHLRLALAAAATAARAATVHGHGHIARLGRAVPAEEARREERLRCSAQVAGVRDELVRVEVELEVRERNVGDVRE